MIEIQKLEVALIRLAERVECGLLDGAKEEVMGILGYLTPKTDE